MKYICTQRHIFISKWKHSVSYYGYYTLICTSMVYFVGSDITCCYYCSPTQQKIFNQAACSAAESYFVV